MIIHPAATSPQMSSRPSVVQPPAPTQIKEDEGLTYFDSIARRDALEEKKAAIEEEFKSRGVEIVEGGWPTLEEIKSALELDRRLLELKQMELSTYRRLAASLSEQVNSLTQQVFEADGLVGSDLRDGLETAQTELFAMQRLYDATQAAWEFISPMYLEQIAKKEALLANYGNNPDAWGDPK